MYRRYFFFVPVAVFSLAIIQATALQTAAIGAQQSSSSDAAQSSADLFPGTTIALLRVEDPAELIQTVLSHPMRASIEEIEDVRDALKSTEYRQINIFRRVLETQLEMKWDEAIAALSSGGVDIGFDAKTQGVAVITTAKDKETLQAIADKLLDLAEESKKLIGEIPLKKTKYRTIVAYEAGPIVIGLLDNRLLVSNQKELAKDIADRYLDKSKNSLADSARYKKSQKLLPQSRNARLYVDLDTLRKIPDLQAFFAEKTENIGIEFLIGGIQSNLRQADYAVANLQVSQNKIELDAATPHDSSWVSQPREFFFGKQGQGQAPALLIPKNSIFSVTTYRDIGQLWLSKEDLFEEGHIAELAQADSQFSTIFSGMNFGEEILGATKPGIQIVGSLQDYQKLKTPQPDIKIPSFAFIFQLKEPQKIQQRFKVGFQSVIGFFNIALSQQGQPQLDIETDRFDDGRLVTTSYLVEEANKDEGLINYNFSPSVAFVKDYFIISSTESLARELVELARKKGQSPGEQTNTFASINGKMLQQILAENRDSLVAQNMLEEGSSKEDAEKQIDQLLKILEFGKDASLKFENHKDRLQINLQINLRTEK